MCTKVFPQSTIRTVLSIDLYRPNLIVSFTKYIHSVATDFRPQTAAQSRAPEASRLKKGL
jgi:hypothetical protein